MRSLVCILAFVACGKKTLPLGTACTTSDACGGVLVCLNNACAPVPVVACDRDSDCGAGTCTQGTCAFAKGNAADFLVTATDATLLATGSATSTVTITRLNGHSAPINISISGAPGYTSDALSIATSTGSLVLHSSDAACGPAALTVTANDGNLSRTATLTANVNGPTGVTVSVSPNTVSLLGNASAAIAVTISKSKCATDVPISVTGLPSSVSAAVTASGITLTVAAGAPASAGNVTVHAGSASTDIGLTVSSQVAVTFIDGFGRALTASQVTVQNHTVTADAQGRAVFTGNAPYDLVLGLSSILVYRGLTEPNPTIQLPAAVVNEVFTSTDNVYGTNITGGASMLPAGSVGTHLTQRIYSGDASDGSWRFAFNVYGPSGTNGIWCLGNFTDCDEHSPHPFAHYQSMPTVTQHALQMQMTTTNAFTLTPVSYTGYVATTTTLSSTDNTVLAMAPVGTNDPGLQVSTNLPAGFTAAFTDIFATVGVRGHMRIGLGLGQSITRKTPAIAGATTSIVGAVFPTNGLVPPSTIVMLTNQPLTGTVTLTPAPPTDLTAPASGITGVNSSTVFSWSAFPNASYVVFITKHGSPSEILCQLMTSATSVPLLDTSVGCTNVPVGQTYDWHITAVGGYPTMDAVARDPLGWLTDVNQAIFHLSASERDGSYSVSSARSFSVAP